MVLNVSGVSATKDGFVTVWPCDATRTLASNLNLTAGSIRPNLVIAKVDSDGKVCLFTSGGTDLVADLNGYFLKEGAAPPGSGGRRILNARVGKPQLHLGTRCIPGR